jgi:hypothetical protein
MTEPLPPTPTPAGSDLRTWIRTHLISHGEDTAAGMAAISGASVPAVEAAVRGLIREREIYRVAEDPDGQTYARSARWRTKAGMEPLPGEFLGAEQPLPDITLLSFASRRAEEDPQDGRTESTPVGYMIDVGGVLQPRIFADPERAVVTGVALRHIPEPHADWAATAFFRIIADAPEFDE